MKTGISWDAYGNNELDIKAQIGFLKKYGFEATFPMSDNPDIDNVIYSLQEADISVDTCHAPFHGINKIWLDSAEGDGTLRMLTDSVDVCSRHGVPISVVHLSSGDNAPRISDAGYRRFKYLTDYAQSKNVTIAFENQRKLANLAFAMEEFKNAGFCWDVGHEACFAYGRRYMPLFGSRLIALHIHDNFGVHNEDRHMIPFDAGIDYEMVTDYIVKSGYEGTVMLELMRHTSGYYEDYSPDEYFSKAASAADRLRKIINDKRTGSDLNRSVKNGQ